MPRAQAPNWGTTKTYFEPTHPGGGPHGGEQPGAPALWLAGQAGDNSRRWMGEVTSAGSA
jgi:hypothetical protein